MIPEEERRKAAEEWEERRRRAVDEAISEYEKEAERNAAEARRIRKLKEVFPDLQRHEGRWKKIAYSSPSVNGKCNQVELRHNCGCCSDSPLEAWPYLETEHGKIYSSPSCFQVGEAHWISGDKPYDGWKEKLRNAGISESIIEIIRNKFKADAEERKEIASESDYEDDE